MRPLFESQTIKGNSGFTMVELIVVVVILAFVAAIGIPTYHLTIKPTAHLKGAARQLYSDIQLARLRAVSRNARCGMVFSAGPSYIVFVDDMLPVGQYEYTDDGNSENDEEMIKTVNLANEYLGVQFDTAHGGGDGIDFANSSFSFSSRGLPSPDGDLYLINQKGEGRKIVVNIMGGVQLEKY
ncbi:MAG: GspH/FimT family protein [Deltaproteobacteria bacterium]|nr:GspH/FimT family protein [Deltaproteobacteria bacterium]